MGRHIEFQEVMPHPNGIWLIRNKRTRDVLGTIEWYVQWRTYVAEFVENSVWSEDCLGDVQEFLRGLSGR